MLLDSVPRALYGAFDRFPSRKGAAVHIDRFSRALFARTGGGLLYAYPGADTATLAKVRADEERCWTEADVVVVPADAIRATLVRLGCAAAKIVVIPNGADIDGDVAGDDVADDVGDGVGGNTG